MAMPSLTFFDRGLLPLRKLSSAITTEVWQQISMKISRTHIVIIVNKQNPVFREIVVRKKCNEGLQLEVKTYETLLFFE